MVGHEIGATTVVEDGLSFFGGIAVETTGARVPILEMPRFGGFGWGKGAVGTMVGRPIVVTAEEEVVVGGVTLRTGVLAPVDGIGVTPFVPAVCEEVGAVLAGGGPAGEIEGCFDVTGSIAGKIVNAAIEERTL